MKILILGHNGMLGNAVYKYFNNCNDYEVSIITTSRYPEEEFLSYIKEYDGDYIINCIGAIPQKTNNFEINCLLPVYLDLNTKCKIIHPGTDCESDTTQYGISKRIASDWLWYIGTNTKIIKTSIIGIDKKGYYSLLSWVLSQTNEIDGYVDAKWNGVTSLTWAKYCEYLILNWDNAPRERIISCTTNVSKYTLLKLICEIFNHDIKINPIYGKGNDKTLKHGLLLEHIVTQLLELKEFYNE